MMAPSTRSTVGRPRRVSPTLLTRAGLALLLALGATLLALTQTRAVALQTTSEPADDPIASLITGFLKENTNFQFADEERAAIQKVDPQSYDNFEGPGVPPGVDVSSVAITEVFAGQFMFDSDAPGFAESLFASTFSLGSGELVDEMDAPGFVLSLNSLTPEGKTALVDYATGNSATLPPVADLFMPLTLESGVPPDVLAQLRGESDQLLANASPQPSGWLVDPLFGPGGTLSCGPHDGYEVLCDPTDPSGSQFSNGFGIYAMGIAGPLDAMGPPYVVEAPIVLLDGDGAVYFGAFDGDFFNGGNHAFTARSTEGTPPVYEHLQFNGSSWPPAATGSRMVVAPQGTALIHDHGFHPAAVRYNTFKAGERRPGLVGSYSVPDMTQAPMSLDGVLQITPGLVQVPTFDVSTVIPEPAVIPEPDSPPGGVVVDEPVIDTPIIEDPVVDTPVVEDPVIVVDDPPAVAIPAPPEPGTPLWPWIVGATGIGLAGTGTIILRNRRRLAADNLPMWSGEAADDAAPLTDEDFARYAKYGIGDHTTAQQAEQVAAEKAAEVARGNEAERQEQTRREAAHAAIQAEHQAELQPAPAKPDLENLSLTNNPVLAFGFEFVHQMEQDLTSGRARDRLAEEFVMLDDDDLDDLADFASDFASEFADQVAGEFASGRARDRLAEVIWAMPDAYKKAGDNVLNQLSTAVTGWGEIFANPALLTTLDEATVYAGEQVVKLGEDYLEAAQKDSAGPYTSKFVEMTASGVANAQVQTIIGKGLHKGGKALANRLQQGVAAPAAGATAATRTGTTPVRTPPARSGSGTGSAPATPPPAPAKPPPAPVKAPPAPTPPPRAPAAAPPQQGPLYAKGNGYGSGFHRVPVRSGAGTPKQVASNGCGAAVLRGIMRDLGLAVPSEGSILLHALKQGLFNPAGGITAAGMVQVMRSMLPATAQVVPRNLAGIANKAGELANLMANNPSAKVMVGIRWAGVLKGGKGHWLRVEAVGNGWVTLGDPALGSSIAITIDALNNLAEAAIAVLP